MGERLDFILGEPPHFLLHRGMSVIETGIAECRHRWVGGNDFDEFRLECGIGSDANDISCGIFETSRVLARYAKIREANGFALAHCDATRDLSGIFAETNGEDQAFYFAGMSVRDEPLMPTGELAHRLDVRCQPS